MLLRLLEALCPFHQTATGLRVSFGKRECGCLGWELQLGSSADVTGTEVTGQPRDLFLCFHTDGVQSHSLGTKPLQGTVGTMWGRAVFELEEQWER